MSYYFAKCDILCCSETWLNSNFSNGMLEIPGKNLFRIDTTIGIREVVVSVFMLILN